VTSAERAKRAKRARDGDRSVVLPAELPPLTRASSRTLLAILIELTEVPLLDVARRDESGERGTG
jgi:hypothetical protein